MTDTPKEGELIELFAPRDPIARLALWRALSANPHRKVVIKSLRTFGNVLAYSQDSGPPESA